MNDPRCHDPHGPRHRNGHNSVTTPDDVHQLAVTRYPVAELRIYHRNPRVGNVDRIAESLRVNGQYKPVVVNIGTHTGRALEVLAGNHTLKAARDLGWDTIAAVTVDVDDDQAARIVLADNRTADLATHDDRLLLELLADLPDLDGTGYDPGDLDELEALLNGETDNGSDAPTSLTDPDDIPNAAEPDAPTVTQLGDLWHLGPHRLLCGDSTNPHDVARVVDGATLTLIHADPPYGMGKEADGVLNDNLYGPKLDEFQMRWWNAWLPALTDNGSAYIWGNAPDLWRLWWVGGLAHDDLLVRNELVWDKGSAIGMRSPLEHSYPNGTERCLFLMRGQQFLGSLNQDDFWEGYEPLRAWLEAERNKAGWTNRDVNSLTGTQMAGHWFSRSQFAPISVDHYRALQAVAAGRAFTKDYGELFDEMFPDVKGGGNAHRRALSAKMREDRTYFDNAHDVMRDVWEFPRVTGDERHGHATPKPVAMVERAFKSSSQPGDTIGVPFGGSGPEFIAAHRLGRVAVAIELEPRYVDVICRRYQEHTGTLPTRDGEPHDFTTERDD
jgi:DNA modification methylase